MKFSDGFKIRNSVQRHGQELKDTKSEDKEIKEQSEQQTKRESNWTQTKNKKPGVENQSAIAEGETKSKQRRNQKRKRERKLNPDELTQLPE